MPPSSPEYVFTRDYVDNNRINLQHYLWGQLFGYLTHPDIPTDRENTRVADVGTGTGIWLTDLGAKLPSSAQLDGLDVSFDATPPPQWLPSNMNLHHWDIKAEPPNELIGVYDIVHVRNFSFVLQNDSILGVVANLLKLLKPGGYLQWAEPDVSSFRIEKTSPENKTEAMLKLLKLSQGQDSRLRPTWVPELPSLFTHCGLEGVKSDVKEAPPHLALAMHECNLVIHELIARKSGNEEISKQVKAIMLEVAEETRLGSCWAFTRWTVVGKKPLEG